MMEIDIDCFIISAHITTASLWELCSSVYASLFIFFFQTNVDKHCSWSFVLSLNEVSQFLKIITTQYGMHVHKEQLQRMWLIYVIQQHQSYFINTFWRPFCEVIGLYWLIFSYWSIVQLDTLFHIIYSWLCIPNIQGRSGVEYGRFWEDWKSNSTVV